MAKACLPGSVYIQTDWHIILLQMLWNQIQQPQYFLGGPPAAQALVMAHVDFLINHLFLHQRFRRVPSEKELSVFC